MTLNKLRVAFNRLFLLAVLVYVVLKNPPLRPAYFYPGLLAVLVGCGIRLWAAGTIRKNEEVIRTGPYSISRHPLYVGSFLIGTGILVEFGLWWFLLAFFPLFFAIYVPICRKEESYLKGKFGKEYEEYAAKTPLLKLWDFKPGGFSLKILFKNKELWTTTGVLVVNALCLLSHFVR